MTRKNLVFLAVLVMHCQDVSAGEISGLPTHLPPTIRPDYLLYFGNDFLSPGTNDDYRTQQITVSGRFADRWFAAADLSLFTRQETDVQPSGRIDTLTFSLGYEVLKTDASAWQSSIMVGAAVRAAGDFEGARIQNGFHRLVGSGISDEPYTGTRSADPAAWTVAETYRVLRPARRDGFLAGWDIGAWGRAGAFVSTGGQFDAVAGAYLVASRAGFDIWTGVRHDWRSGYGDDFVLADAADQENSAAFSWGLRWGALVIETVARQDSEASYGQVSFVSAPSTRGAPADRSQRIELLLGLEPPQMTFSAALRYATNFFTSDTAAWREFVFGEIRAGQPQYGSDTSRFVETYQGVLGLELARTLRPVSWLSFYANAGVGYRSERLFGLVELTGQSADSAGSAVLTSGAGLEVDAARLSRHWRFKLRLGVTGWLPFSDATVSLEGDPARLLQPDASFSLGWGFSFY